MKKTLTVNLGGTVFHIDEDAYRLLDQYLSNLTSYFESEEGGHEIIKDIEARISELFNEKICTGYQVITIADAEEVIKRIGEPEEFAETPLGEEKESAKDEPPRQKATTEEIPRKFYRDPDNVVLGGVIAGLAAYMGWDTTPLRLIVLLLCLFVSVPVGPFLSIPIIGIYIILWIVVPKATTIAQRLAMRGKKVTMENIGKTVTDRFQKVSNRLEEEINNPDNKSRLRRVGDQLVEVVGSIIKILLTIFVIVLSPLLFLLAVIFLFVIVIAIGLAFGKSTMLLSYVPGLDNLFINSPWETIIMSFAGVFLVGIPLVGLVYTVAGSLMNWKPMATGLKITLVVLWILSLIAMIIFPFNILLPTMI